MRYPLCMFFRQPYLTSCVLINYALRRFRLVPDEWYDKDRELLKIYLKTEGENAR